MPNASRSCAYSEYALAAWRPTEGNRLFMTKPKAAARTYAMIWAANFTADPTKFRLTSRATYMGSRPVQDIKRLPPEGI